MTRHLAIKREQIQSAIAAYPPACAAHAGHRNRRNGNWSAVKTNGFETRAVPACGLLQAAWGVREYVDAQDSRGRRRRRFRWQSWRRSGFCCVEAREARQDFYTRD